MEHLPAPDILIPKEAATLRLMLDDQRNEWLGALASIGRGSYDGVRKDRQARANLDHLLDHFPNGSPRDHLVQHAVFHVPANVLVGNE